MSSEAFDELGSLRSRRHNRMESIEFPQTAFLV
jgi:hypothetical protein